MRVLVIGGGGREHALVWKLRQSPLLSGREDLLCLPGNHGIQAQAVCLPAPDAGLSDIAALARVAAQREVDLTVIGPELPLAGGLVDALRSGGLKAFGATRAAARLEWSKAFAKEFMARHGIPTAPFRIFTDGGEAARWLGSAQRPFPVVVKADGLAAGKGVIVAREREEAVAAARAMLEERRFGAAGETIVVEDHLSGREVSFFAMTDGQEAIPLATCQDYKRARDGDRGPNTGGMGACSPSVEMDDAMQATIMERVIRPAVAGMASEGTPYSGVLYAGLMITDSGPMVLEFNARFGDPETQVLMPRIEGDLLPLLMAAAGAGTGLEQAAASIAWKPEWAACVVMASSGYPASADPGRPIHGLDAAGRLPSTVVFHAGTRAGRDRPETAGGRVLAVSALGRDLREALQRAYHGVDCISFEGMRFRRDIGQDAVTRLVAAGRIVAGGGEAA